MLNPKEIKSNDKVAPTNWGQPNIALDEPIKEKSEKETPNQKSKSQDSNSSKIAPSQPEQKVKPNSNSFNVQLQPKVETPKMSPSLKESNTLTKTEKNNKKEKEEDKLDEKVVGEKTTDFATPPKDDDKKKDEKANQNKDNPKSAQKEKTALDKNATPKKNPLKGQEVESQSSKQKVAGIETNPKDSESPSSSKGETSIKIAKPQSTEQQVEAVKGKTDTLEKTASQLNTGSKEAFNESLTKISEVAAEQQTTKSAEEKRIETEKAVQPSKEEALSEVNTDAVETVDNVSEPELDPDAAKNSLAEAIKSKMPKDVEDVKRLAKSNPAEEASVEMNQLINSQTEKVKQTYNQIENTAEPVQKQAEAPLPAPEAAPLAKELKLSEGLIPKPAAEQSDFQEYAKASDDLVKNELQQPDLLKEFETSDAAPMVEARTARDGIKEDAEKAPTEAAQVEQSEKTALQQGLQDEEQKAISQMTADRAKGIADAQNSQIEGKSKFEQEKLLVSENINKIYKKANDQVKDNLKSLEEKSMKTFKEGQQLAFDTFDKNVDKELEAFFDERHSGIGGFFTSIGDWFSGTDDLPEVQAIFEKNRIVFVNNIDQLIEEISTDCQTVIKECEKIIADAKIEIDNYVNSLGGKLKEYGQGCQNDISKKLDKLAEDVKKKGEELKEKLKELRAKAIEAIDKKIEERKEKMKGALSKLGNFLLDLAMKFFTFTLTSMGMSPDEVMGIINKGIATITAIITNPIGFFSNLGSAVAQGLDLFQANFKKHMIGGMMEWLTGAMGGTIEIPQEFSLKGILKMGLSILGLTWSNIRMKLVKHVGENIVAAAETGFEMVTILLTEGPMGLWEWIKEEAESIKTSIIEGIKEWALITIVKNAVLQIALMLNPAGAIVRAIIAIYDLIMWLVDNIERIISFVNSVISSITNIAAGNISGAAGFIESAIAKTIPMILSGLAQFLKLGGISKKIKETVEKVRKPIDKAISKGLKAVADKVKKWFGGKKAKPGDAKKIKEENKTGEAEKLDPKDEKKHKEIADKIESKLKQSKIQEKEDFKDFHKRKQKEGEELEDKYQPQLKKGINLDVKFKSVQEDEKDGDMDIKIRIAPNTTEKNVEVGGKGKDEKLDEVWKQKKENIHPKAEGTVSKSANTIIEDNEKETDGRKKISSWTGLRNKLKETKNTDSLIKKPITNKEEYGVYIEGKVGETGREIIKDDGNSNINDKIKDKIKEIEGHPQSQAFIGLRELVFDGKSQEEAVFEKVKKVFEGDAPDHGMYEPKDIVYVAGNGKLTIKYKYIVEVDGKKEERNFESSIEMLEAAKNGANAKQTTIGENLVLKTPATRGKTDSADSEKAMESLDSAGKLQDQNSDLKFNASHVLADMFLGSGYKSALNLVITSAEYNQKTMRGAEDLIKGKLKKLEERYKKKNEDNYISFDLQVSADWQNITDHDVYEQVKSLSGNSDKELLKSLHEQLKNERDPKLCKAVEYKVIGIKLNGIESLTYSKKDFTEKIGEDVNLKGILKN